MVARQGLRFRWAAVVTLSIVTLVFASCESRDGSTAENNDQAEPDQRDSITGQSSASRREPGSDSLLAFNPPSGQAPAPRQRQVPEQSPQWRGAIAILDSDFRQDYEHPPIRVPAGDTVTFYAYFPYVEATIAVALEQGGVLNPLREFWGYDGGGAQWTWVNNTGSVAVLRAYAQRTGQTFQDPHLRESDHDGFQLRPFGYSSGPTAVLLVLRTTRDPGPATFPDRDLPLGIAFRDTELRARTLMTSGNNRITVSVTRGTTVIDSEVLDHQGAQTYEATVENGTAQDGEFRIRLQGPNASGSGMAGYGQIFVGRGFYTFGGVYSKNPRVFHGAIFTEVRM
jgi:hypothetical protein